jgi:hypothetical protein
MLALVSRKSTPLVQSGGRLATGVVLVVWAIGSGAQQMSSRQGDVDTTTKDVREHAAKQQAQFAALNTRFEAIDLSTVLTPKPP